MIGRGDFSASRESQFSFRFFMSDKSGCSPTITVIWDSLPAFSFCLLLSFCMYDGKTYPLCSCQRFEAVGFSRGRKKIFLGAGKIFLRCRKRQITLKSEDHPERSLSSPPIFKIRMHRKNISNVIFIRVNIFREDFLLV